MAAPRRRQANGPKPAGRLRKAERQRQLLAAAKHLFATHGYQQTRTEMIAQAAGVSEPVLYRHFDSKKGLFLEVLRQVRQATLEHWQATIQPLTDPLTKLHALADLYLDSTRERALEFRIMHRTLVETHDAEVAALVRDFYLDSEALLAQIISEGQQTGVFRRNLDPRVGAWEIIRTALGYTLTLPLGIPLYQQADYLPRAIECLLNCLLKTDV
jgi:AcrR family transcriptional regulator